MIGKKIQSDIATGRFTLPVVILLSLLLWGITSQSWSELGSLAIIALTGYLMIEINTAFSIIRTRTTFPISIYWITITALFFLHPFEWTHFIPLLYILALFPFFHSYESANASTSIYHTFLFIGIGSLIFPPFVYFIPLFLIFTIPFRALNLKSLLGGVLGLTTPYWFLLGHAFYHDQMHLFYEPIKNIVQFCPITYTSIPKNVLVSWGIITILLLISSFHFLLVSYLDKTRTRIYLAFLVATSIWTTILILLQPLHIYTLLQVQLIGTAFLTAHLFTLTRNRFTAIFFMITFVTLIMITYYNLWIQY